jgi:hypothetical protein
MAKIPLEAVIELKKRLETLPSRCTERRILIQETASLYGISEQTMYRILKEHSGIKSSRRADCGIPRITSKVSLERYCEVIAALKIRTSNKKGRHISTAQAIRLDVSFII